MSRRSDPWLTAIAALQLSARLIEEIQAGVHGAGFADVSPLQGFAFVRIAAGGATAAELAEHLGVSKQAAAQLTERLVQSGYVTRSVHLQDRRARRLELTARGRACTRAARRAAQRSVQRWREELPPGHAESFEDALLTLTAAIGTLRPAL